MKNGYVTKILLYLIIKNTKIILKNKKKNKKKKKLKTKEKKQKKNITIISSKSKLITSNSYQAHMQIIFQRKYCLYITLTIINMMDKY